MRYLWLASAMLACANAAETSAPAALTPAQPDATPEPAKPAKLEFGAPVNLESVTTAKWLKGEPLKAFEPGKVYLFECWATWCGPCIGMIPHMNELYQKYHDKGLEVFGADVFEDDFTKVEEFVKNRGKMEYPVFFSGRKSSFAEQWLAPAGVRSIPTTLVVKDGKFVMSVHPARLTHEIIELMLTGDDGLKNAKEELARQERTQAEIAPHLKDFTGAESRGEIAKMEEEYTAVKNIDDKAKMLDMMLMQIDIAKGEYQAALDRASRHFEKLPESKLAEIFVGKVLDDTKPIQVDPQILKSLKGLYQKTLESTTTLRTPTPYVYLSMLSHRAGIAEDELAYAEKAATFAKEAQDSGMKTKSIEGYEKYLSEVKAGNHPTRKQFFEWVSIPAMKMKAR